MLLAKEKPAQAEMHAAFEVAARLHGVERRARGELLRLREEIPAARIAAVPMILMVISRLLEAVGGFLRWKPTMQQPGRKR